MERIRFTAAILAGLLLSGGCASQPEERSYASDPEIRQERMQKYRQEVRSGQKQEPLQGQLTLPEAIARAVKYNLDHRVKQLETVVAIRHLDLAKTGFLPEIVAQAGYSSRDNEAGAISRSLATGDVSLEYSTSQEKSHTLSSLRASWDLIDFGLAYYNVQQEKDNAAMAGEQRRKVVQNIIQDVQEAYWRTYIAQQISGRINEILQESDKALERFRQLAESGRIDPLEGLNNQREILQIRYRVRSLQEQLSQGPIHLAALLNLPPGTKIAVAPGSERLELPELTSDAERLEELALLNRPELLMEDSKLKVSSADVRKSLLEMFPHLEFYGQYTHDSNEYLYNNDWSEVGVQLTWNLLTSAGSLGRYGAYQAEKRLAEGRHRALSMAVVSQVHLAINRYHMARARYLDSAELQKVSRELASMINQDNLRKASGSFARIQANLQAAAAQMETMLTYAEGQNALMRLYNTLGLDPLSKINQNDSIQEISLAIEDYFQGAVNSMM